ncbi:MAG: hypothetical protein ACRDEA_22010 [Microcystaceae cyanobacterium]
MKRKVKKIKVQEELQQKIDLYNKVMAESDGLSHRQLKAKMCEEARKIYTGDSQGVKVNEFWIWVLERMNET